MYCLRCSKSAARHITTALTAEFSRMRRVLGSAVGAACNRYGMSTGAAADGVGGDGRLRGVGVGRTGSGSGSGGDQDNVPLLGVGGGGSGGGDCIYFTFWESALMRY